MPHRLTVITHEACALHRATYDHPESPDRLETVLSALEKAPLGEKPEYYQAEKAPLETITRVHPLTYLDRLKRACENGNYWFDFEDTYINEHTYEAALRACGAVVTAVDMVASGERERVFCPVRPPGHHAERETGMGFCLINNVAVGAMHAREAHGISRVMIIDWDVHHGNGTQHIFEEDPSVFYVSIHEHPTFIFPGTGRRWEQGKGEGTGFTLNLPLPPGSGDAEYLEVLEANILPAIEDFRPELLLISAGFDAHRDDPLGDMEVTEFGFYMMTKKVVERFESSGGKGVVSVLEGGYDLPALARSVEKHLIALTE